MGWIADEIRRGASEAGLTVAQLGDVEATGHRTRIEATFSPDRRRWPLWEGTCFRTWAQDTRAWEWIREFVGSRRCVLLFNPDTERSMFRLETGADLDALLRETAHFEFYVSDEDATYLLCFNHHDVLLAAGAAIPWLEAEAARRLGHGDAKKP